MYGPNKGFLRHVADLLAGSSLTMNARVHPEHLNTCSCNTRIMYKFHYMYDGTVPRGSIYAVGALPWGGHETPRARVGARSRTAARAYTRRRKLVCVAPIHRTRALRLGGWPWSQQLPAVPGGDTRASAPAAASSTPSGTRGLLRRVGLLRLNPGQPTVVGVGMGPSRR